MIPMSKGGWGKLRGEARVHPMGIRAEQWSIMYSAHLHPVWWAGGCCERGDIMTQFLKQIRGERQTRRKRGGDCIWLAYATKWFSVTTRG